jgi:superfamily II DNA or RNA helicase
MVVLRGQVQERMIVESFTRTGTTLPWSPERERQFSFKSIYDGEIQVFQRSKDGISIEVPRGGVPLAQDLRDPGIPVYFDSMFNPQKPEQLQVIAKSVALLKSDQSHIVAAPTGWGKTFVGSEIAGQMGRRFCVITTKEDIIGQWVQAIRETLLLNEDEVGIWRGDSVPSFKHKAVVSLIQSVMKGPERYGEDAYLGFGLVLCDEVHRMGADGFSQAMWHFPSKHRLGMSATPWRKDGKDRVFTWHIGPVMVEAKMEVLIPKILIQKSPWKIPKTSNGQIPHDFGNISLLMKPMCRNPARNALIVEYLKNTYAKNRCTIAFTDNLEHIRIISDLLLAAGIPETDIGYYVGVPNDVYGGPKKGQYDIRKSHSNRKILLSTYKMASEATNLPWLDTCVMMTPRADVEQIVGRIRREYDDKQLPLVVDFVDDDSVVLAQYAKSRFNWYQSLGCQIVRYS